MKRCYSGCRKRCGGWAAWWKCCALSAATHELPVSGGRALTRGYQSLLDHYELKSTRIFPRKAHENGVVEQAHRRTKSILAQMLVLRGSHDFPSVDESALGSRSDRTRAQRAAGRKASRGTTASAPAASNRVAGIYHVHSHGPPLEHDPGS